MAFSKYRLETYILLKVVITTIPKKECVYTHTHIYIYKIIKDFNYLLTSSNLAI